MDDFVSNLIREHGEKISTLAHKIIDGFSEESSRLRNELQSLTLLSEEYEIMEKRVKEFEEFKDSMIKMVLDSI